MAETPVIRFLRILNALEGARKRNAVTEKYRQIDEELYQKYVHSLRELESLSGVPTVDVGVSILATCLTCYVKGTSELKHNGIVTGFWEEALKILREEGFDAKSFLVEVRSFFGKDQCFYGEWMLSWIAQRIQ